LTVNPSGPEKIAALRGTMTQDVEMSHIATATTGAEQEIEITPEMIEAGYRVLYNSGIADGYLRADKVLVAEIFATMFALRPARAA
jgi:hypothetical protein